MKSIIIKVLYILVLTLFTTAWLYPTFEGWEYEFEIFIFVLFASIILFVLTETLRYFHRISDNKRFIFYSLVFYVVVLLFSIYGSSSSFINYLDYKNDFTSLYPPKAPNDKPFDQYRIVISDKFNPDNPDIDSSYRDNLIEWIDDHDRLSVRKEAFETTSLAENERKIYWSFSMFLAFSIFMFFSILEIKFYGKKWERNKILVDNKKNKIKEHPESIIQSDKTLLDSYSTKINEARHLVAQDRANEALEILIKICPKSPHFQNQMIVLKKRLSTMKNHNIQSTLDSDQILISSNRISQGILELIDNIELELKK